MGLNTQGKLNDRHCVTIRTDKATFTNFLDLLYCMIDFIKEINIHFNNIESKKFSCSFVSQNPYFFFFNKLNQKSFKRKHIINWDLHLNYIMDLQSDFIELNKKYLELSSNFHIESTVNQMMYYFFCSEFSIF